MSRELLAELHATMAQDPIGYIEKHKITPMLNDIVNSLVVEQPDDPISFIINGLLKEANVRGQEPALLQRLVELKQTLLKDQKAADAVAAEKAKLEQETGKLKNRITHLLRTLDEFEKKGPTTKTALAPAANVSSVPPGHTPFSWAGGVEVAAAPATSAAPVASASQGGALTSEPFSARVAVAKVLKHGSAAIGSEVAVGGWARSIRFQKDITFVKLSDGEQNSPPPGLLGCTVHAGPLA